MDTFIPFRQQAQDQIIVNGLKAFENTIQAAQVLNVFK